MSRPLPSTVLAAAALAVLLALAGGTASGAKGGAIPYRGLTDQDRKIRLIVDRRGRVKRGTFKAVTRCGGRFKPFTGEFAFRSPLDRSRPDGFRDEGTALESDGTFSGRYKWDVDGKRKGKRKIAGELSVAIVFRKDGRKYATCTAEDVAYSAKLGERHG